MKLLPILALGAALLAPLARQASAADPGPSPATAFKEFGMLGTWSPHCDQAVAVRNPRYTYTAYAAGNVEITSETGSDTARTTVQEAFLGPDHALHVTGRSTFEELPRPLREALEKSTTGRPGITVKSTFVKLPDESVSLEESSMEIDGMFGAAQTIAEGRPLNQQTHALGEKLPPRVRCTE